MMIALVTIDGGSGVAAFPQALVALQPLRIIAAKIV
jgi:hypothetical protein